MYLSRASFRRQKPGESPADALALCRPRADLCPLAFHPPRRQMDHASCCCRRRNPVWTGLPFDDRHLSAGGYFLLALPPARLLIFHLPARQFLFNERFAAYAVLILCFGVVIYAAREHAPRSAPTNSTLSASSPLHQRIRVDPLSLELWDHFGSRAGLGMTPVLPNTSRFLFFGPPTFRTDRILGQTGIRTAALAGARAFGLVVSSLHL